MGMLLLVGHVQDRDWRMMESRPSEMMEMFEHQGTAAAELASEDYALHQRVRSSPSQVHRDIDPNSDSNRYISELSSFDQPA